MHINLDYKVTYCELYARIGSKNCRALKKQYPEKKSLILEVLNPYMSQFAIKAIQLLMSLSLLIVLHELGHFIPARIFKTRVEKFFLFFDINFALFKKKIGDTVYGIGWLPLGGYVKIAGMIDESMDKEQMKKPPQPWEFRSKPAWQRLIIMLGGVTVNLILGFLIYMMILFVWGKNTLTNEAVPLGMEPSTIAQNIGFQDGDKILSVDGTSLDNVMEVNRYLFLRNVEEIEIARTSGQIEKIAIPEDFGKQMFESGEMQVFFPLVEAVVDTLTPGGAAAEGGLEAGDKIIAFNGMSVSHWGEFYDRLQTNKNPFELVVERGQRLDTLTITPDAAGKIGVRKLSTGIETTHVDLGLMESIKQGFAFGYWTLYDYVSQFKYVFTQKGATQVGGFGAIGNLFPSSWDWRGFWSSTALISIMLAFMNVLPIPALDGGHVMFLLYEILTGRKPHDRVLEVAQVIGFFLILGLVLFANGNDVYRYLFGS